MIVYKTVAVTVPVMNRNLQYTKTETIKGTGFVRVTRNRRCPYHLVILFKRKTDRKKPLICVIKEHRTKNKPSSKALKLIKTMK
jgi:hypothetical protein